MILRLGDIGAAVGDLQRRLYVAGYTKVVQNNVYDDLTQSIVRQLQTKARLVVDGIYGPKTEAYLRGMETGIYLKQADLQNAAETLDISLASILAVNEVESLGTGFIKPTYPKILFERHIFWRQLIKQDIDPVPISKKYPGVLSQQRGGYAGGISEYTRLKVAKQINSDAAFESTSWGAFQIMGFHWESLGFSSVNDFVADMMRDEKSQLDVFVRFILADTILLKALQQKKWTTFAKIYNGPAFADNLYDVKLARAYKRYADLEALAA